MKKIKLGTTGLEVPAIVVGCMRLAALSDMEAEHLLKSAIDSGANFFDHADIYGKGECEERFARVIHKCALTRERLILQSKCGIRPELGMYDCSREHILHSVDGILKRLQTDYLDILLLHRPDALMDPEEVAEAFDLLYRQGKVRHFGVSNQNPGQISLLQKTVKQKLEINQLQFSITNCGMLRSGMNVNMENDAGLDRDGGVLDFCRLHDITVQAWSPFQHGMFEGAFLGSAAYPDLNHALQEIAEHHDTTPTTIAAAWILRHPARIQVISGTTRADRLREICAAADLDLSREEWYQIYRSAGNQLP